MKVEAMRPTGKILEVFTPLVTFEDEDLKSWYIKDQLYYLREGNDILDKKVKTWFKQNRISFVENY